MYITNINQLATLREELDSLHYIYL